jgi:hypothetical protein
MIHVGDVDLPLEPKSHDMIRCVFGEIWGTDLVGQKKKNQLGRQ